MSVQDLPSASVPHSTDLLERLAAGDTSALHRAWLELGGVAMAVALRVLGSRAAAEQVVVETFAEVWRQATAEQPRGTPLDAWVTLVAWRRARSRRAEAHPPEPAPAVPPLPLESAERRRTRARLTRALGALSTDDRAMLEQLWFDGTRTPAATDLRLSKALRRWAVRTQQP